MIVLWILLAVYLLISAVGVVAVHQLEGETWWSAAKLGLSWPVLLFKAWRRQDRGPDA